MDLNIGPVIDGNNINDVDEIFAYFIKTKQDALSPDKKERQKLKSVYLTWFMMNFPKTEFSRENLLFWHMCGVAASIGVIVTEKYIRTYIQTDLKEFIFKEKLHVKGTDGLQFNSVSDQDNIVRITANRLMDEFYRLSNIEQEDVEDFKVDIKLWMNLKKSARLEEILTTSFETLDNLKNKRIGADDSLELLIGSATEIKLTYDESKLEDLEDEDSIREDIEFVCDSGIPFLDNDTGGIFETQMFGIEAGEGAGKSRFVRGTYGYRALTVYKINVLDIILEQSKDEGRNMYLARHIFETRGIFISDSMIRTKKDDFGNDITPEVQEIIDVADYDLFKSGKYGKLVLEDEMIYLETFIERFKLLDRTKGPFKLLIVDYLTLIEQERTGKFHRLEEHQVYKYAYKWFKRYIRKAKKAAIVINQVNGSESASLSSGKSAGQSKAAGTKEARNTPDRVDVISYTPLMKEKGLRKIEPVKGRSSRGVGSAILKTELGQCYFEQDVAEK